MAIVRNINKDFQKQADPYVLERLRKLDERRADEAFERWKQVQKEEAFKQLKQRQSLMKAV